MSAADFRRAQERADAVARVFGDSAPRSMEGEGLFEYRARLLGRYQQYSPPYRSADLSKVRDPVAFCAVETQIYADALREARHPTNVRPGELRQFIERDPTGRPITRFVGDPEGCWGPFKRQARLVTGFNTGGAAP